MQNNTQVETRSEDGVGIIEIGGEVTSFSEKVLESGYEQLTGQGLQKICLNFAKVSYINSAGMAIIIGILTKGRAREQTLRCCGLTEHFQKIFEMVGITKYMPHFASEELALKDF